MLTSTIKLHYTDIIKLLVNGEIKIEGGGRSPCDLKVQLYHPFLEKIFYITLVTDLLKEIL